MMGPEALRERDLHRYYQPYRNAQTVLDIASIPVHSHQPQFSGDKALTAFAQLACLRLKTRRCLVSLIDSQLHYILTEATPSFSLSRHTVDHEDDRVWFGSATINRKDGICENALNHQYTARAADGSSLTGEGFVVTDASQHPLLKDRPYVVDDPCVRFYAGVPITTRTGLKIGVYAVSDNKPRPEGLGIDDFCFLQDMAECVMDHLQMIRHREDRSKGERMVRGLAEFIEGSFSLTSGKPAADVPRPVSTPDVIKGQHPCSPMLSKDDHGGTENKQQDEESLALSLVVTKSPIKGPKSTKRTRQPSPSNPNCLFYRAAELIRKSTFADGVVFFRTINLGSLIKMPQYLDASDDGSVDDSTSASSDGSSVSASNSPPNSRRTSSGPMNQGHRNSNHKQKRLAEFTSAANTAIQQETKKCEVIGLSISESAPGEELLSARDFVCSETSMTYYLRRFPHGKFFSFAENGADISSGEDKIELRPSLVAESTSKTQHPNLRRTQTRNGRKFLPTEILRVVPGIRTLIFLPLWDLTIERWIAGAFIWTSSTGTLMSPHNELPYLRAFGNSITSEYARLNALIADRAKSDFISSVSHELRSPIHGILGSVEFLYDTSVSSYQENLLSAIQICSKTLLETLEHILDYAKINKVNTHRGPRRLEAKAKRDAESSIMGPVTDGVDLNQVIEEVCESVCAGHAFRETHNSVSFHASLESLPKGFDDGSTTAICNLTRVSASLEISRRAPLLVETQPGAVGRIIMNLLGNALKYTSQGFVAVRVEAVNPPGSSRTDLTLTIQDSGKGISLEYQRTRLFSPFSQEDPFADGTGLGLSIVRQIVDSLGGQIDITSKKDVGTTVEVHLSFPCANSGPTESMQDVLPYSRGKHLTLLRRPECSRDLRACIQSTIENCREWFDVHVNQSDGSDLAQLKSDAILCSESYGGFTELNSCSGVPLIIVCRNQTNQAALRKRIVDTLQESARWNFKIVAQPIGPMKLSQALRHIWSRQTPLPTPLNGISFDKALEQIPQTLPTLDSDQRLPVDNTPASSSLDLKDSEFQTKPTPSYSIQVSNAPERPHPIRFKSGLSEHSTQSSQHHILCVEDNQVNMRLLMMFMKKFRLPCSSAGNGLEALESYKRNAGQILSLASMPASSSSSSPSSFSTSDAHGEAETTTGSSPINGFPYSPIADTNTKTPHCRPFTYVLMDISMPVMDGLEATRRIRAFEQENRVKKAIIVALTGLASAEAQREALDAGVDFYFAKPVKFADLQKLMEV